MRAENFMIMSEPALTKGVKDSVVAGVFSDPSIESKLIAGEERSFEEEFLTTLSTGDKAGDSSHMSKTALSSSHADDDGTDVDGAEIKISEDANPDGSMLSPVVLSEEVFSNGALSDRVSLEAGEGGLIKHGEPDTELMDTEMDDTAPDNLKNLTVDSNIKTISPLVADEPEVRSSVTEEPDTYNNKLLTGKTTDTETVTGGSVTQEEQVVKKAKTHTTSGSADIDGAMRGGVKGGDGAGGTVHGEISEEEGLLITEDKSSKKLDTHDGEVEIEEQLEGRHTDVNGSDRKNIGETNDTVNNREEDEKPLSTVKTSPKEVASASQAVSGNVKTSDGLDVSKERSQPGVESKAVKEETLTGEARETLEAEDSQEGDSQGDSDDFNDDLAEEMIFDDLPELEEAFKFPGEIDADSFMEETFNTSKERAVSSFSAMPFEDPVITGPGTDKVTAKTLLPLSKTAASHQGSYISKPFESVFIKGVAARVSVVFNENVSKATITLNPPELGRLKVEMSLKDNIMQASFRVENMNVKEVIERNIETLKTALLEQGLSVDELNVSLDDNYREGAKRFADESSQGQRGGKREGDMELSITSDIEAEDRGYYSGDNSGVDLFI